MTKSSNPYWDRDRRKGRPKIYPAAPPDPNRDAQGRFIKGAAPGPGSPPMAVLKRRAEALRREGRLRPSRSRNGGLSMELNQLVNAKEFDPVEQAHSVVQRHLLTIDQLAFDEMVPAAVGLDASKTILSWGQNRPAQTANNNISIEAELRASHLAALQQLALAPKKEPAMIEATPVEPESDDDPF
jgi:hypothetical protein